jgi:hypothetical protein
MRRGKREALRDILPENGVRRRALGPPRFVGRDFGRG